MFNRVESFSIIHRLHANIVKRMDPKEEIPRVKSFQGKTAGYWRMMEPATAATGSTEHRATVRKWLSIIVTLRSLLSNRSVPTADEQWRWTYGQQEKRDLVRNACAVQKRFSSPPHRRFSCCSEPTKRLITVVPTLTPSEELPRLISCLCTLDHSAEITIHTSPFRYFVCSSIWLGLFLPYEREHRGSAAINERCFC